MRFSFLQKFGIVYLVLLVIFFTGCGLLTGPAPKPEIGPSGKPAESKSNPPLLERFFSAPKELYDLEATAGVVFEGINKSDWSQAQAGLATLQSLWQQVKDAVGDKKGIKEGDDALNKLTLAVNNRKVTDSYESLIKFMGSAGDVGKSYKLSPIADIIAIGNGVRNVSFFVEDKDWQKAASKIKELQGTWEKVKPSMEQIGILGEITKTHSTVNQMKDAINAENKGAFLEQQANINESIGHIRDFFRGK